MLCSSGVLRLMSAGGAAGALQELQRAIGAEGWRQLASLARRSSWGHPHELPATAPSRLDIPAHEIEPGLPEVNVWLRQDNGTNACSKLRKGGLTPCVLFSLPGNESVGLSMDSRDAARLVRDFGRNGLQARVLRLNIMQEPPAQQQQQQQQRTQPGGAAVIAAAPEPQQTQEQQAAQAPLASVRVLPKAVHLNSVSLAVEHLRFLFCPPQRRVTVNVPVKLWGDDVAPGVKSGGWLHVVNRAVPLRCPGSGVVPALELDVRHMRLRDVVRFRDVPLPPGCELAVPDALQPVVRCAARVGGD